jgi:hypothetical protein
MDGIAPADLYERDFYAWTQDQAARLRALGARNDGLDVENLAEEVESLGKSDRRAAESLLGNIIDHLLKLRLHPDQRARRQWMAEVKAFRRQLSRILRDSPSLRARRAELASEEWRTAARAFLDGLEADGFDRRAAEVAIGDPDQPFFDLDAEVLNEAWFPDPPSP